jgi:Arc/MetJ family transcription regulator
MDDAAVLTHIALDDELLQEILRMGRFTTKKAAVHAALEEYARLLKRRELLRLRGKVRWDGDLDRLRAARDRGSQP